MSAIGIDFGTTNSVVAQYSAGSVEVLRVDEPPGDLEFAGFHKVLPSVFALGPDRQPLFGWSAKRQTRSKIEAVKRLFATEDTITVGDETFFVEEIAAMLFGYMRKAALDQGVEFDRAVVTVPANSRGLARYRTKLCAGMAGIEVAALINEPTAAAMAFGLKASEDQTILVVDWGGGTLDVTILGSIGGVFVEEASKGIQRLGGIDFDKALERKLLEDLPDSIKWSEADQGNFRLEVERAKLALSYQEETSLALPGEGRRLLTRKKLNEWVSPLLERCAEPIQTCLADRKMSPGSIDHVLLVGGTCMMPAVRDFVSELLGREPVRSADVNAMTAIGQGAAVAAAILSGEHDADFFVSTEHALGTIVHDEHGQPYFSVLIPRNHKLPAKESDSFVPVRDYQDSVNFRVVEGDDKAPLDHEDNVVLKEWVVPLPARPAAETQLDVTYEYDVNGIVHVTVTDRTSGDLLLKDDVAFMSGRDARELVSMAGRVESVLDAALESLPPARSLRPEVTELLERARAKVIPFVPEPEAKRLADLSAELEEAADGEGCEAAMSTLDEALRRYAYLY
jgi:molecular chaperone DnaK (HSP70)